MDNTVGLASYDKLNGYLDGYHTNGPVTYHSDVDDITKDLSLSNVSEESLDSPSSKDDSCISAAFDEDYPVNGEEEVKTPCASPTLDEFQPPPTIRNSNFKPPSPHNILDFHKSDQFNFITKFLTDAVLRPCQYTLEKRYDESIPVHTLRRSIRENLKLSGEKLSPRPFTPVRRLETIVSNSLTPLPRLTSYSSSSGSLIGNINSLSFEPSDLVFNTGLSLANGVSDRLPELSNLDLVKVCRSAEFSHDSKNGSENLTFETSGDNNSGSNHVGGELNGIEHVPQSAPALLGTSQLPPTHSFDTVNSDNTTEDGESRFGTSDTGDSNVSRLEGSKQATLKSKHIKRSGQNRSKIHKNSVVSDNVHTEPSSDTTDCKKKPESPVRTPQSQNHTDYSNDSSAKVCKVEPHSLTPVANGIQPCSTSDVHLPDQDISLAIPMFPDDSTIADGDFTLVTTKKHKRQQKLQQSPQNHQHSWIPPAYQPPTSVQPPVPGVVRPLRPTITNTRLPVTSGHSLPPNKPQVPLPLRQPTMLHSERRRVGNGGRNGAAVRRNISNSEQNLNLSPTPVISQPTPSSTEPSVTLRKVNSAANPRSFAPSRNPLGFTSHPVLRSKPELNDQRCSGLRPAQLQLLRNFLLSSWHAFKQKAMEP